MTPNTYGIVFYNKYENRDNSKYGKLINKKKKNEIDAIAIIKNGNKNPLLENIKIVNNDIANKNLKPIFEYESFPELNYIPQKEIIFPNCHSGQRKLLLSEIEFLTDNIGNSKIVIYAGSAPNEKLPILLEMFPETKFILIDPNYHIINYEFKYVYQNFKSIGDDTKEMNKKFLNKNGKDKTSKYQKSASNLLLEVEFYENLKKFDVLKNVNTENMVEIMKKFKSKFYLNFIKDVVKDDNRVWIIQDYMTRELSGLLRESVDQMPDLNFCFISDIRTNMVKSYPVDIDFVWNDALQMIFIKTLKPTSSMIKFHPPYFNKEDDSVNLILSEESNHQLKDNIKGDIDFVKDNYNLDMFEEYKKGNHLYFDNKIIYLQAWARVESSEVRLVISKDDINNDFINYDHKKWEKQFMYFKFLRGYGYHGLFYEKVKGYEDNNYDGCFDCSLEMYILSNYLLRNVKSVDVDDISENLESKDFVKRYFDLKKDIDDKLFQHMYKRCPFHGQITKPLNDLYFYKTYKLETEGVKLVKIGVKDNKMYEDDIGDIFKKPGYRDVGYDMKVDKIKIADNVDNGNVGSNKDISLSIYYGYK